MSGKNIFTNIIIYIAKVRRLYHAAPLRFLFNLKLSIFVCEVTLFAQNFCLTK